MKSSWFLLCLILALFSHQLQFFVFSNPDTKKRKHDRINIPNNVNIKIIADIANKKSVFQICDKNISCDESCKKLLRMFKVENAKSTWNHRHPGILQEFINNNVTKSVEIGIARGGLSFFLLSKLPNLHHHGIDPFIGSYDNNGDSFSRVLAKENSSIFWANAIKVEMAEFQWYVSST